jgi:hypothetical protein
VRANVGKDGAIIGDKDKAVAEDVSHLPTVPTIAFTT